jgi:hypothetical protein
MNFSVSTWNLKPGEAEEAILGPIPAEQKKQAEEWAKKLKQNEKRDEE